MTASSDDHGNTAWHEFLSQQGAIWQNGQLCGFRSAAGKQPWLIPLEHQSLLAISGPDAEKFLQGQVTCDMQRLRERQVLLGAHCDPKGRMHSSFVAAHLGDDSVGLRLHHSLVTTAQTLLQKYIVFSKAELTAATDIRVMALVGAGVEEVANYLPLDIPEQHQFVQGEGLTLLRHSHTHLEIWARTEQAQALWLHLAPQCSPASPEQWDLAHIDLGVGQVRAQTAGEFLPQMLNMEHLGGISFDKGCYTGQEVVARMHYLGRAKKHMYRAQIADTALPEPGTPLFKPGNDSSIGQVIMAANNEAGQVALLVVCPDDAFNDSSVTVGSLSGPVLQWQPLPYTLD